MKPSNGPINGPNRVAQLSREGGFINEQMQRNHPSGCARVSGGNGLLPILLILGALGLLMID